ncbi:IS3 family transposase [Variovorax paradoxus]|uniref:IS3 family transposase n=1 Tax=Variovorax paradoxus TaxID=34073 RepID=UPI003D65E8C1
MRPTQFDRSELSNDEVEAASTAKRTLRLWSARSGRSRWIELVKKTPRVRLVSDSENSSIIAGPKAAPYDGGAKWSSFRAARSTTGSAKPDERLSDLQVGGSIQDELFGYGYPRVTHELRRRRHFIGHKRIACLMTEAGLVDQSAPTLRSHHQQRPRLADLPESLSQHDSEPPGLCVGWRTSRTSAWRPGSATSGEERGNMGHFVTGLVADRLFLQRFANQRSLHRPKLLHGEFAILPLRDIDLDSFLRPPLGDWIDGFNYLSRALIDELKSASLGGSIMYFETDYFGGRGSQGAALFRHGEITFGPAASTFGPINDALELLGVCVATPAVDAFQYVGLDRHRYAEGWLGANEDNV